MGLTPEERKRIYEEERARMEVQEHSSRERTAPLEAAIAAYQNWGFRVLSRSETTAQLIKPRRYHPFWGCLGLLTVGIFWVIGLLIYLLSKDQLVTLSLDERGKVWIDGKEPYAGRRPARQWWE